MPCRSSAKHRRDHDAYSVYIQITRFTNYGSTVMTMMLTLTELFYVATFNGNHVKNELYQV